MAHSEGKSSLYHRGSFRDTQVKFTTEGKSHLGADLAPQSSTDEYVTQKVHQWSAELIWLSSIADTQPHATFAEFTIGLVIEQVDSRISRTTPNVDHHLLRMKLIPALTGHAPLMNKDSISLMNTTQLCLKTSLRVPMQYYFGAGL